MKEDKLDLVNIDVIGEIINIAENIDINYYYIGQIYIAAIGVIIEHSDGDGKTKREKEREKEHASRIACALDYAAEYDYYHSTARGFQKEAREIIGTLCNIVDGLQ